MKAILALSVALWITIAEGMDRIAVEVEKRSPAAAHALRLAANEMRRSHASGR